MSYDRRPTDTERMSSLKVDNLSYRTTPDDLRRAFDKYGDIGDIYIPRDRFTRKSRGFAFVRFYDKRDAEDAMDAMDMQMLDGRELRVQMARYARPPDRSRGGGGGGGRRGGYGGGGGGGYRDGGGRDRDSRDSYRDRDYSRRSRRYKNILKTFKDFIQLKSTIKQSILLWTD